MTYQNLKAVLDEAFQQAAEGKGEQRHGLGRDFGDQPIFRLIADHGLGFATGQAAKKLGESLHLPPEQARQELLGAIIYSAAAILALPKD